MTSVVPLTASQVDATAAILARAMDDDPAYRFLFPAATGRLHGLTDYFARTLRTHLPYRCTQVLLDQEEVIATVTVRPPEGFRISTLTMIRRGLLPFALAHGGSAVRRMFALKDAYDRIEAELAARSPHWHVHMMAVAPSRQGKGLGSLLLERVLTLTADSSTAYPTVLTTHNQRNVIFYTRAGFHAVGERELALPGNAPYRVWGMAKRRAP